MTISSAAPASAASSSVDFVYRGQIRTGPFMLTLCQLEAPVAIRPPELPQLRRFTFFTTSAPQRDRGEHVYLHMGYFESLTDAESLLRGVRRRFPQAIAGRSPSALPQLDPETPAPRPSEPRAGMPAKPSFAPVADESLTDTQVMRILETRGGTTAQREASSSQIGVLRPEDTSVRRALKEAVVEGAPVFFAVQLDWSTQLTKPDRVPPLPIFKTHTLYTMQSRREGRCRYFLRLGFFADAASAKEAAFCVRSKFASAVVVPVTEQEFTCAHEAARDSLGLAHVCLPIYEAVDQSATVTLAPEPGPLADRPRRSSHSTETLEQTLEALAAREMWNEPDSLSDTGVRHLRVEVLDRNRRGF
ncbi:MAG: hypothetical protein ACREUT_11365 [Steroidobacteraceae bacterium]